MFKKLLFLLVAQCALTTLSAQVIKIRDARAQALGATVTIRGIATNGAELGQTIRYMQDSTAGLAIFYTNATQPTFAAVKRGDSLEVTGVLKDFNGLLEIDPITTFRVINSNNPITPLSITAAGMAETNESELVRLTNGTFTGTGGTFAGNTNYTFVVGGTNVQVRVQTGSVLIGRNIPTQAIDLQGIVSDFRGTYQLLPRDSADLIFQGIAITTPVSVTNQTQTGLTLNWQSSIAGNSTVAWGTSPTALSNRATVAGARTSHSIPLSNLSAATVIYARVVSAAANGSMDSTAVRAYITNSNSTGETRVYFNRSVDASVRTGNNMPAETNGGRCESELVNRILQAKSTIDVAMYSSSSTTIRDALKQAAGRGVRVRYLADRTAQNNIFNDTTGLGFRFQRSANQDLMHNKFMVFDADSVNSSWVMTGAMNNTIGQIYEDPNNMVMIQDQSLARIYRLEFNELWGSDTAIPNTTNAKAGAAKADNTPHELILRNNRPMEVYFSPSDRTSTAIIEAINSANSDLQLGLMIFTYFDLGTVANNAKRRGVDTRGIVNWDTAGASSQPNFLIRGGTPIRFWSGNAVFHHKYAIIDAKNTASDPIVVTGSHNWTNSAEVRNDENTIIIHDPAVANIFLQEFEARWKEAPVSTDDVEIEGLETQVFPNPAREFFNVSIKNTTPKDVNLTLFNSSGQPLESRILRQFAGETTQNYPLSNVAAGTYFLHFSVDGKVKTVAVQVVK
jgi:phosphatidylserine/phosphatidylglycerophosphate/cardiolipin synthase-like enzyme/DNA/RNA endonuclease YhcR with UshA esterase domain